MADTKKQAELRNEVYQYLRDNGYVLTVEHQRGLSKILKNVYEQRVTEMEVEKAPKQEVHATCPSCLGVRVIYTKGKPFIVRAKKMSEFRTKGFVASGARANLQAMIEKHPGIVMDCLDAAYVAGVDDSKPKSA